MGAPGGQVISARIERTKNRGQVALFEIAL